MIGTCGPCAEFIRLAHKAGFHPTFVNVSFVGADALAREFGAQTALDSTRSPGSVSLEGYLSGRLAAAALELAGPHPTRAGLLRTIHEVGRFDISGSIITVGPKMQDAPPKVFLTVRRTDPSTGRDGETGLEPVASAC
jgi:branched-chain amino acid transport system substrate-binding protein